MKSKGTKGAVKNMQGWGLVSSWKQAGMKHMEPCTQSQVGTKPTGHGWLLFWSRFRIPDVSLAPVLQNFNVYIYKVKITSLFSPSPKEENKFLDKKGILKV